MYSILLKAILPLNSNNLENTKDQYRFLISVVISSLGKYFRLDQFTITPKGRIIFRSDAAMHNLYQLVFNKQNLLLKK